MSDDRIAEPAIQLRDVCFRYGGVLALSKVDFTLLKGDFAALLGANGAGKSTLAKVLAGMLRPDSGSLVLGTARIVDRPAEKSLIDLGVALVPERRRLFGQMSVEENFILAAHGASCPRAERRRRVEDVLAHMPQRVQDGRNRATATFSGGEQQMIAIGRAIMAAPSILIIDEPSLGLAPIMVDRVYELLQEMNARGVSILTIEQIATHALQFARHASIIDHGTITHSGPVSGSTMQEALRLGYLGHVD